MVYDIFPPDTDELKLIRMVVSDVQVRLNHRYLLFSIDLELALNRRLL